MSRFKFDTSIGQRVLKARLQVFGDRGQRTYARVIGQAVTVLVAYERGKNRVPIDFLVRFSRLTGAPLLWLILGEPEDFNIGELEPFEGEVRLTHEQMIERARASSPPEEDPHAHRV